MTRNQSSAEATAVSALGFIASDPELLNRFIAITGIEPGNIREAAKEPGFLAGVLDFLLAHEPTLMAFSQSADINPTTVAQARRSLPHGSDVYDRSI